MKHTLEAGKALALASIALWAGADSYAGGEKIIGGSPVAVADSIASTTVAFLNGGALCTASIVAADLVLTAAHCVEGGSLSEMRIVFSRSAGAQVTARVVKAVVPSRWRAVREDEPDQGDIALVRFAGRLPAGYRAANLLADATGLRAGQAVTLAGYGITQTHPHTGSGRLRRVQVAIAEPNFGRTEILFDQRAGRGACHGDSGGPAFVERDGQLWLLGLTNRGYHDPADTCRQYAVYTKVSAYRKWLSAAAAYLRR